MVKGKTICYGSAEEHRVRQAEPVAGSSFTKQFYDFVNTGAFETFMESDPAGYCNQVGLGSCPGGFASSSTVGPIFNSQLQKFPLAMPIVDCTGSCLTSPSTLFSGAGAFTGDALGIGLPHITYPVPLYALATESLVNPLNQYRVSIKVDHKLGAQDQLNGVYLLENVADTDNFGSGSATFGVPTNNPSRAQTAGITYIHTFSPTLLNQFKFRYSRHTANFTAPGTAEIPDII